MHSAVVDKLLHPSAAAHPNHDAVKSKKSVEFIDVAEGSPLDEKDSKHWRAHINASLLHRFTQDQRTSLLGRPIQVRTHRKDIRYRKLQSKIYNFLERPRGFFAATYHTIVFLMVLLCLGLSVVSTIPDFPFDAVLILYYVEIVLVIWFTIEYCCRVWSSGCRSRYQGCLGRFKFTTRPFCIIDLIVITASVTVLCLGGTGQVFATSAIRGLRFFQILRMVRIDRRGGTWKLLGSVVWAHRQELITTMYIGFLGLIFASFLVYMCEKNVNEKFATFADALWWGVITLCTVGYGDKVPQTWMGRLIASFCALLGISFFALPAGILGSGFALKVQQQQRQKHLIRRRVPAAELIQSVWRLYASQEQSRSQATWARHLKPYDAPIFKVGHQNSFASRFARRSSKVKRGERRRQQNNNNSVKRTSESEDNKTPSNDLAESGDKKMLKRQESGGSSNGPSTNEPVDERNPTPLSVWRFVEGFRRASRCSMEGGFFPFPRLNSYSDDDTSSETPAANAAAQLSSETKNAIRFIRRLQYLASRRKFREALKPYDVKDVIEQYSSGHADLVGRVRIIQSRLDTLLGKSCNNTSPTEPFDSKNSMAHRIMKIERKMEDVETKLDYLIELQMESRKTREIDTLSCKSLQDEATVGRKSLTIPTSQRSRLLRGGLKYEPLTNSSDLATTNSATTLLATSPQPGSKNGVSRKLSIVSFAEEENYSQTEDVD